MLEDIELIIYDLDGVLIDSSEAICRTFNAVLNEVGERDYSEDRIRAMIGEPLRDMYREALPQEKHSLIDHCFNRYVEIFKQTAVDYTRLLDGVEDTLTYFSAKGLRQTVATTKSAEETDIILRGLNVKQYFDLLLGITDVTNPKPHPEIIYQTLQRLGVDGNRAVLIGDTTIDVETGKRAEIYTIAVPTGTHTRERLVNSNPDYISDNIQGLKDIIVVS